MAREGNCIAFDYVSTITLYDTIEALAFDHTHSSCISSLISCSLLNQSPLSSQRAARSPTFVAMTLRSRILGSSKGDITLDESNSLAVRAESALRIACILWSKRAYVCWPLMLWSLASEYQMPSCWLFGPCFRRRMRLDSWSAEVPF